MVGKETPGCALRAPGFLWMLAYIAYKPVEPGFFAVTTGICYSTLMALKKTQSSHAVQLFKFKHGSVHAVVIGPEIGWRWRRVKYYRSKRSTRVPGGWDEITDDWGKHNPSLIKCALAVQKFLDTEAEIEKTIQRSWAEARTPAEQQALLEQVRSLRNRNSAHQGCRPDPCSSTP